MSFPVGPGRVCHPYHEKFNISHPECSKLYASRARLPEGWRLQLEMQARLALEVQNCSSVQACGLGKLFLTVGALTSPGFDFTARSDRVMLHHYLKLQSKVRSLQWRHLHGLLRRHRLSLARASALAESPTTVRPEDSRVPGLYLEKVPPTWPEHNVYMRQRRYPAFEMLEGCDHRPPCGPPKCFWGLAGPGQGLGGICRSPSAWLPPG